jgi:hypothetical protein
MQMIEIEDLINNGKNLEIFTASYFQSLGYYIESNLKWIDDKEDNSGKVDVLELDVLAKTFMINSIKTTLVECKRGCTFNDFFKFAGIAQLIKANENILVCQSKQENEIKKLGTKMGIKVQTPNDMSPALLDENIQELFLFFFISNKLSNQLFDKEIIKSTIAQNRPFTDCENRAYNEIRKYMADLIGKVWRNPDLSQQASQIKQLLDDHPDFVREIARILQIKPGKKSSEFYMKTNPMCQAAGYLVLKVRISYIICAVQCAYLLAQKGHLDTEKIKDDNFIKVVNLLHKKFEFAIQIPYFLQSLIYIFGGSFSLLGDTDIKNISHYLKMEQSSVLQIIKLLEELFLLSEVRVQWGFIKDMKIISFKYVPYPLKGIGILNREKLGFSTEDFGFQKEWKESLKKFNL